jgi:hypothetical protein
MNPAVKVLIEAVKLVWVVVLALSIIWVGLGLTAGALLYFIAPYDKTLFVWVFVSYVVLFGILINWFKSWAQTYRYFQLNPLSKEDPYTKFDEFFLIQILPSHIEGQLC